jgi:hypothetical protein
MSNFPVTPFGKNRNSFLRLLTPWAQPNESFNGQLGGYAIDSSFSARLQSSQLPPQQCATLFPTEYGIDQVLPAA